MRSLRPAQSRFEEVRDPLHVRLLGMDNRPIVRWDGQNVCSSFWRLYVNATDAAWLQLETGVYPLPPERVHLVPAWVRFSCCHRASFDHFFIHFDLVGVPGSVVRQVFSTPFTLQATSGEYPLVNHVGRAMAAGQRANLGTIARAKALTEMALADLIDQLPVEKAEILFRFLRGTDAVAPALQHIDAHLPEPISNEVLADACCLSPDHFIRRFRQSMGQTPAQYVLERRIAQAAEQLILTDDSIERICQRSGFANRFYFTRMFTRRMGVPPATYRRTERTLG